MSQIYEKFVTYNTGESKNISVTKITDICDNWDYVNTSTPLDFTAAHPKCYIHGFGREKHRAWFGRWDTR